MESAEKTSVPNLKNNHKIDTDFSRKIDNFEESWKGEKLAFKNILNFANDRTLYYLNLLYVMKNLNSITLCLRGVMGHV